MPVKHAGFCLTNKKCSLEMKLCNYISSGISYTTNNKSLQNLQLIRSKADFQIFVEILCHENVFADLAS